MSRLRIRQSQPNLAKVGVGAELGNNIQTKMSSKVGQFLPLPPWGIGLNVLPPMGIRVNFFFKSHKRFINFNSIMK